MSTAVPQSRDRHARSLQKPWPAIVVISWLLVTAALASAALTGRNIGKPTWWLGTEADPAFALLWVTPFLAPIVAIVTALVAGRWAPFAGMGAALWISAIGIVDIEATPAVALIEVIIAISALFVSIASLAGRRNAL